MVAVAVSQQFQFQEGLRSHRVCSRFVDGVHGGGELKALAAAQWGTLTAEHTPRVTARIFYQSLAFQTEPPAPAPAPSTTTAATPAPTLYLDRVMVRDMRGNRCGGERRSVAGVALCLRPPLAGLLIWSAACGRKRSETFPLLSVPESLLVEWSI